MDEDKRTPDEWAKALSLLPPPRRPGHVPECPLLEGAKVHYHWVQGDLLTRAEFEEKLKAFGEAPLGAVGKE